MCQQGHKACMNRHSDVTAKDEDRGTLLPQGRNKSLKRGIQNRGRQISDEKDRSFEDQSSFEWGNDEEQLCKREAKSKTKRQVSFDIDDKKTKKNEMSRSPEVNRRSYHGDISVTCIQPSRGSKSQTWERTAQQQYVGCQHYTNGSTLSQNTHMGYIRPQTQSASGCYGNGSCTNTLGNNVCYHSSDSSFIKPASCSPNTRHPTGVDYNNKQYQSQWPITKHEIPADARSKVQEQHLRSGHSQNLHGQSANELHVQNSHQQHYHRHQHRVTTMESTPQVIVKCSSQPAMSSVSDSCNLLGGNLTTCPDYGSCTLTPDYSSDNFQETFMKHVSPTSEGTKADGDGCRGSDSSIMNRTACSSSQIQQDIGGTEWPYVVPKFDDLFNSDYDLSAHCKATRSSSPEGQAKSCDKESDDASVHLDYSQLYNTGYYQLTYCDSDSQKEKKGQLERNQISCVQDNNVLIHDSQSCSRSHKGCKQSKTADHKEDNKVNEKSHNGEQQHRQVSVDSNKSMVSDFDGHEDTAELLPKIGQKAKSPNLSKKRQQQRNISTTSQNVVQPNQNESPTKATPTLLTSKKCGIKFHTLEVKPEDIAEANRKNQIYASNLGETVEDIWLCDSIKSPDEKTQSDKEGTCEVSSEILDDEDEDDVECVEHKDRDIDFWDYDNSSTNSNYLNSVDVNKCKASNPMQIDTYSEECENSYNYDFRHQYNSKESNNISHLITSVQEYEKGSQHSPHTQSIATQHVNHHKPQKNPETVQCLLLSDLGPISPRSKKTSCSAATTEWSSKTEINNSVEVKVEIHPQSRDYVTETLIEEKQDQEKGEKESNQTKLKKTDGQTVIEGKDPHVLIVGKKNESVACKKEESDLEIAASHSHEGVNTGENEDITKEAPPRDQLGKHLVKQASDASRSSGNTSVSNSAKGKTKQLQKVVYYQNRFITVPIDPHNCKGRSVSKERLRSSHGSVESKKSSAVNQTVDQSCVNGGKATSAQTKGGNSSSSRQKTKCKGKSETKLNSGGAKTQPNGDMNPIELENSIISMQTTADDKDESDGKSDKRNGTFSKADAVFHKIKEILQDKRCDEELTKKSHTPAKRQNNDLILKKTLNIIFIAIGVILLLGVVIVIIYTTIGKPGTRPGDLEYEAAHAQNNIALDTLKTNPHSNTIGSKNEEMPGEIVINAHTDDVFGDQNPSAERHADMDHIAVASPWRDGVNEVHSPLTTTTEYAYGYELDHDFMLQSK